MRSGILTTFNLLVVLGGVLLSASCAGYRIGAEQPEPLVHIRRIAVPMARNDTLHPRAETVATSSITDALAADGTYRLAGLDDADAVLECTVSEIGYSTIRGSRVDALLPVELTNRVTIDWRLLDARDPTKLLAAGRSSGSSQLFVSANLQLGRNNALTEATERAARQLVARISNGI